jgi:hypothetical protein
MLLKRRTLPKGSEGLREAILWLQGRPVGHVVACGRDGPWHFGWFVPAASFESFAPQFAAWAQLMRAGGEGPLTADQRAQLTRIERSLDTLRAWLVEPGRTARRTIAQLNIDGDLIEWKER